jgi:hypothetical protein
MVIETSSVSFTFSPVVSLRFTAPTGGSFMSDELTPLDLMSLVPRLKAARMRGVSARTLDAKFRGRYTEVSERRKALRLYEVLDLPAPRLSTDPKPIAPPQTKPKKHVYGVALTRVGRPRAGNRPA